MKDSDGFILEQKAMNSAVLALNKICLWKVKHIATAF